MFCPLPKKTLKVVSRGSNLAKAQVAELQKLISHFYPDVFLEPFFIDSRGDRDKITSLRTLEKSNFFTDTLDLALLKTEVDLALHSAKDLPFPLDPGLEIAALTPCIDERDALVFASHVKWEKTKPLPSGLRIATSSKRRENSVLEIASKPFFYDLRGTIEERLAVLETGKIDAVVLAEAALKRLNLTHLPRVFLPGKTTEGQGSLAIVVRKEDKQLLDFFSLIDARVNRPKSIYLGIDPSSYQKKTAFPLIHLPLIETQNFLEIDSELFSKTLLFFNKATHIILTSPRSAKYLSEWMAKTVDERVINNKIWWCIGSSTAAALHPAILKKEICAKDSTAEAIVSWIDTLNPETDFIFFPHSELSRPLLRLYLETKKIPFNALAIYQTKAKDLKDISLIQEADELIFTSPSCVDSFYNQTRPSASTRLRSIGSITEVALQKYNQQSYTASNPFE